MRHLPTAPSHTDADIVSEGLEGLIKVASMALRDRFPQTRIDLEDLQSFVEALLLMAPKDAKVKFASATLCFVKKDWREAADIYRALVDASEGLPYSRAMLAYSLNRLQDPEWRVEADPLRESGDAGVSYLARSLIAQDTGNSDIGPFQPEDKPATAQAVESGTPNEALRERGKSDAHSNSGAPAWINYGLRA